jgi:hydroxymethylbilane synthase
VVCERSFLASLDGSCRTPIAGLAQRTSDGGMAFRGLVASPDGKRVFETSRSGGSSETEVTAMGKDAGEQLKGEAGPDFFDW